MICFLHWCIYLGIMELRGSRWNCWLRCCVSDLVRWVFFRNFRKFRDFLNIFIYSTFLNIFIYSTPFEWKCRIFKLINSDISLIVRLWDNFGTFEIFRIQFLENLKISDFPASAMIKCFNCTSLNSNCLTGECLGMQCMKRQHTEGSTWGQKLGGGVKINVDLFTKSKVIEIFQKFMYFKLQFEKSPSNFTPVLSLISSFSLNFAIFAVFQCF